MKYLIEAENPDADREGVYLLADAPPGRRDYGDPGWFETVEDAKERGHELGVVRWRDLGGPSFPIVATSV